MKTIFTNKEPGSSHLEKLKNFCKNLIKTEKKTCLIIIHDRNNNCEKKYGRLYTQNNSDSGNMNSEQQVEILQMINSEGSVPETYPREVF